MTEHDDDLDPAGVLVGQTYDQSWPADPPPDGYRWVSVQRDDSHPVYDGDMAAAVAYATHIGSPVPPRWGRPDDPDQDPSDLTGCDVFVAVPGPPPAAAPPTDLPRETGPGRSQLETTGLVDLSAADLWRRHGLSDRWAAASLGDGLHAYPLAAASFPTYEPDQSDDAGVRQWPNPATRTFTEQQANAVTQQQQPPPPRWRGEAVLVAMLAVAGVGVGLALVLAGLLILTQGSAGLPLVAIAAAGAAGGGSAGAIVVASRRRVDRLWRDLP